MTFCISLLYIDIYVVYFTTLLAVVQGVLVSGCIDGPYALDVAGSSIHGCEQKVNKHGSSSRLLIFSFIKVITV